MTQLLHPNYVIRRSFSDIDDLMVEASQWELDFRQLDCGPFRGDLLQFGAQNVHISDARFSRAIHQGGAPPRGLRTIAIAAQRDVQFVWRGLRVDGDCVLVFPRNAELSSVSKPDFHIYTCSFPEHLLAAAGEDLGLGDLGHLCGSKDAIRCQPADAVAVRRCLAEICNTARADVRLLSRDLFIEKLTRELPQILLRSIGSVNRQECVPATSPKRETALRRAEAFIEEFGHSRITMQDITRTADVSQRTLEYAFIERFGISPKEYLSAFRLLSVRRQLRIANPGADKIADVANHWGFWHMGQFAADYRKRFGELPSETLRRPTVIAPPVAPAS